MLRSQRWAALFLSSQPEPHPTVSPCSLGPTAISLGPGLTPEGREAQRTPAPGPGPARIEDRAATDAGQPFKARAGPACATGFPPPVPSTWDVGKTSLTTWPEGRALRGTFSCSWGASCRSMKEELRISTFPSQQGLHQLLLGGTEEQQEGPRGQRQPHTLPSGPASAR